MSLITGQLSGLYAAVASWVFAITFRIREDENKVNMSTKMVLLRILNGFLSSLSALVVKLISSDTPHAALVLSVSLSVILFAPWACQETTLVTASVGHTRHLS